jgi:hypothetical protein
VKSSLNGEPFSLNPYSELGAHRFKSRIYGKSEEKVSYCQLKYTVLYVTYLYVGPIAKIYSACITHTAQYRRRGILYEYIGLQINNTGIIAIPSPLE